jgi:hypothetical protein
MKKISRVSAAMPVLTATILRGSAEVGGSEVAAPNSRNPFAPDWLLDSRAWRVFDSSLVHCRANPFHQPLHIATMADILTQLQDAVDQVCTSSKRSRVC